MDRVHMDLNHGRRGGVLSQRSGGGRPLPGAVKGPTRWDCTFRLSGLRVSGGTLADSSLYAHGVMDWNGADTLTTGAGNVMISPTILPPLPQAEHLEVLVQRRLAGRVRDFRLLVRKDG